MICRPAQPARRRRRTSTRWWPGWTPSSPLAPRKIYTLKHTTRTVRAMVTDLRYRLDVNTLHRDQRRDRACRSTRSAASCCAPPSRSSSTTTAATGSTGSFVLIDEATNQTVAGGMLRDPRRLTWASSGTTSSARPGVGRAPGTRRDGVVHRAVGSGKSTIADAVAAALLGRRRRTSSTATTSGTGSTPTSGSRPPTAPRTSAASVRSPG